MMCHKSIIQTFLLLFILAVSLQPSGSQSEMAQDEQDGVEIVEPSWFMVTRISPSYSKDIVADFEALAGSLELPDHLMNEDAEKTDQDFDVSLYFTVLDRLSMKGGRVLDYVYNYEGIGGAPVLYARKKVAPPYRNYSEYATATDAAVEPEEREDYYLRYVDTGGTPEGFFQLALLMIQGEQFYQFWHAAYNDHRIVSDMEDARARLGGGWISENEPTAEGLLADLGKFDLAPVVSMNMDQVKVEVVIFTDWGGFVKRSIIMEREFPHLVLEERSEVLVPYDCGILF